MVKGNSRRRANPSDAARLNAAMASGPIDDVAPDPRRNGSADRKSTADADGRAWIRKGPGRLISAPIGELVPDPRNPRKHPRVQVRKIADSIEAFGFNAPILVDGRGRIVAGHGRFEAAKLLGLQRVPVIRLEHLNESQARAYMLADNKLTDLSGWDDASLALHLRELSDSGAGLRSRGDRLRFSRGRFSDSVARHNRHG